MSTDLVPKDGRQFPWLAGLAAAVLFGLSTPLTKLILQSASPQLVAGLLYLGSGLGLGSWCLIRRAQMQQSEAHLALKDLPWLSGAVLFGGILGPTLLMIGLAQITSSTASLLLNLEGVFTALIAWMFFKEQWNKRVLSGMGLITIGGIILSSGSFDRTHVVGILCVVGACLCWAIDNNVTRNVADANPIQVASIKGSFAGVFNIAIACALLHSPVPSIPVVAETLLLGLCTYGISLVLYILSLRLIGTARTGAYFSTAPFIGVAASLAIIHELASTSTWIAGLFMLAGVWLHISEDHEHQHHHESINHDHSHVHDEHHQHDHNGDEPDGEPHSHPHSHATLTHSHPHFPDVHHRHTH